MLSHYFWLTFFFIMTAISLDFVYHFTNIGSPWYTKHSRFKRFKYCWLISLIATAVPVALHHFSSLPIAYDDSRGICFISPLMYQVIFFIGPALFLSSVNTICFIMTSVYIYQASRSDNAEVRHITDRALAKIFTKVAVLMGVTWIFAIVPSLVGVKELWYVFIAINCLQGFYIFWSFGITPIFKHLHKPTEISTSTDHQNSLDHSVQNA